MSGTIDKHVGFQAMLEQYASADFARFHMPGHKGICDSPLDVTELEMTDDLYSPSSAIMELEARFAHAYGARHSFLLVNGSSSGVLAMLLTLGEGKQILTSLDCHRSVINAAAICDDEVAFTNAEPDPNDIANALHAKPADAVIITSPTYYGKCLDIAAISDIAHSYGALLFVDAAHGAHLPFLNMPLHFPSDKADMWCVSAHKTLDALTQTAILNLGTHAPIECTHIRRMLSLSNTSSPSFILMLSLEKALNKALEHGRWDAHISRILNFRRRIMEISDISQNSGSNIDPTRLVLDVSVSGNTGYTALSHLNSRSISPECADASRVVFITVPADKDEWYMRLFDALCDMPRNVSNEEIPALVPKQGIQRMSIRSAALSQAEHIPLETSCGRIPAVCAGLYPPGSPIFTPGYAITSESIEYIMAYKRLGASLFGIDKGMIPCVIDTNVI